MVFLDFSLAWWVYPLLFLCALFAGTMDTLAGGGGLITVPVLMSLGWTPQDALGTNKFQASFGSGSATLHFARAGAIARRDVAWGVIFTALGAALGAWAVGMLPVEFLKRLIPVLLIAMAAYFMVTPNLGLHEKAPRLNPFPFHLIFGLGIGFYDGFFGPGTGSFWALCYVALLGLDLRRATVRTKVMNFVSNVVSLAVFLFIAHIHVIPGLVMAAGQFWGGRIGARLVLHRGSRLIRPVFVSAALAIAVKLLYDAYIR
jgi:hypothetical protein